MIKSHSFRNLIKEFSLNQKSVLDVGCSEGGYLEHFGQGSMGLTIIEDHVKMGRDKGLNIILKNVEDDELGLSQKFDVLWANNILEHLNSPHAFLIKTRDLLKADGFMILGVPVVPTFSWLTRLKKFRGAYAVSHVNFYTRHTLVDTVRYAGWRIIEARAFYFRIRFLNYLMNLIAPHMYVIAVPDLNFKYPHKRLLSLSGYK